MQWLVRLLRPFFYFLERTHLFFSLLKNFVFNPNNNRDTPRQPVHGYFIFFFWIFEGKIQININSYMSPTLKLSAIMMNQKIGWHPSKTDRRLFRWDNVGETPSQISLYNVCNWHNSNHCHMRHFTRDRFRKAAKNDDNLSMRNKVIVGILIRYTEPKKRAFHWTVKEADFLLDISSVSSLF